MGLTQQLEQFFFGGSLEDLKSFKKKLSFSILSQLHPLSSHEVAYLLLVDLKETATGSEIFLYCELKNIIDDVVDESLLSLILVPEQGIGFA